MAAIDIGVKFSIEKMDEIVTSFNQLIEKVDFGKGFELDKVALQAQFDLVSKNLKEALTTGELDLKKLGLGKLIKDLEGIGRQGAKALGAELSAKALEPFQQELASVSQEIDRKASDLKDITEARRGLTEEGIKKATKEEVGFTGKVMFGGQKEAGEYLKQLKEAEDEDPGANAKRQKLIEFYEIYLVNLKKAKVAKEDLNRQEMAVKADIVKLKAREEALLLKIKTQTSKLDSQSPEFLKKTLALTEQLRIVQEELRKSQKSANDEKKKSIELSDKNTKALGGEGGGFASNAISAGLYYTVLNQVKRLIRESIQVVRELDKAMTEAAVVTDMNRQEAYKLLGTYQDLAKETGMAVTEISGVVVEFLKQGRTMKEALELAEVAAKSAKVAGISALEAANYLTSAVNGFNLASDQAVEIADKFSTIAAASATDFEELAIAMSKVAPTAYTAGIGVDFMMGILAKGLETTREAPENIGTAFKTIFARMREVTDIGKATEDGMSLNRVEKALASIGVPLRDVTGQFRNFENVLLEVGEKFSTLTSIEQAYIATALAGTRQQPRLLAIFNDFTRTKELIELSSNSVGQLEFQHIEYMSGMEAAMSKLQNAWQGFIMTLTDSNLVIGLIGALTNAIDLLSFALEGLSSPFGFTVFILGALGTALTINLAKTLKLTVAKIASTVAELANVAAKSLNVKTTKTLNQLSIQEIALELKKAAAKKAGAAATTLAIKGNIGLAGSFKLLAASIYAALAPLLPFILAIAGIAAVVGVIVFAFIEAGKGAEYFGNEITKVNKSLNDLESKEDKVKKLRDRFLELQKITNKTAEDIEEMKRVSEELGEITLTIGGKEKKYDFSMVDFTGASVFNEEEYNRFLEDVEKERQRLNKQAEEYFSEAVARDGIKAFDEKAVADFAKKTGYEAGVAFADSLGDGFNDETKTKIKKQLADSLKTMDMSIFVGTTYTVLGKEFSNLEDAIAYQAQLADQGTTASIFTNEEVFDEEKLKQFSEKLVQIYANGTQELQDRISAININANLSNAEKSKQILLATVEEYNEQIEEARTQFANKPAELTAAIALIAQTNEDAAILDALFKKEINIDLIYNLQASGLDLVETQAFITQMLDNLGNRASLSWMPTSMFEGYKENLETAITEATSGGAANITSGFANFRETLKDLGYTPEQIQAAVNELAQVVQTLSVEQVGAMITAQGILTKNAMDLSTQIAKGDFSKFGEIVGEYGIEAAMDILNGSEAGIREVMDQNREETMSQINASIAEIYAAEGVTAFEDLSAAGQEQVSALLLMIEYYDDIVGYETLREFRMKQVTGYMKEMNDLLKLQESLLNLGMAEDNPFINTLNGIIDSASRLAEAKIDKQLEDDLANLEEFGTFDGEGNFIVNPDINITQANQAIDAAMSTLTTYVQMQTDAFNRQKKAIEEAAKAEIDAAKDAFNERWKAIEYTDKLREAEEKIFEVRRRVAALAISGVARGEMTQAQDDLRKLEQERRKMVEQQALDEAQKELEAQRDEAIATAQQAMTLAIEEYTAQLAEVLPELVGTLEELILALDDNTEATEEDSTLGTGAPDRGRLTSLDFLG